MRTAYAWRAFWSVGPLEECHRGTGPAGFIAEIKMIAAGVVEVHRFLHKAQAENLRVEIHRPLRVGADESDVMQTLDGHDVLPSFSD
jgi:hypothetical protein